MQDDRLWGYDAMHGCSPLHSICSLQFNDGAPVAVVIRNPPLGHRDRR